MKLKLVNGSGALQVNDAAFGHEAARVDQVQEDRLEPVVPVDEGEVVHPDNRCQPGLEEKDVEAALQLSVVQERC